METRNEARLILILAGTGTGMGEGTFTKRIFLQLPQAVNAAALYRGSDEQREALS